MSMAVTHGQIDAIRSQKRDDFFRKLKAEILSFMGDADPSGSVETIAERVDAAFQSADVTGMITEQQITRYSYVLAAIAVDYRSDPDFDWLVGLLDGNDTADAKLNRLSAVLESSESL